MLMNSSRIATLSAIVLLVLSLGTGCSKEAPRDEADPDLSAQASSHGVAAVNAMAPDFTIKNHVTGADVKLSDYRGKVVMVNFWAPWCPPCREELPDLVGIHESNQNDGFELLGVFVSGDPGDVDRMIAQYRIGYPILTGNERVAQAWQVSGIPTTYIIDREGVVRFQYVGARPRAVFERDLLPLLGK